MGSLISLYLLSILFVCYSYSTLFLFCEKKQITAVVEEC